MDIRSSLRAEAKPESLSQAETEPIRNLSETIFQEDEMGECGCGDFSPDEAVRMGDHILAIEIYPGCDDCGTGLISTLHVFTSEEGKQWDLDPDKEFKPDEYGHAQIDVPLLGKDDLIEAVQELREEEGIDFDDYGSLEDFLKDNGLRLLQAALFIRMNKTKSGQEEQRG